MTSRIQVPLNPDLKKALDEYSQVSGTSRAATCAMFLDQCTPALREMTKALRVAKKAPERALEGYAEFMESTVEEAKQLDMVLRRASDRRKKR